MPRYTFKKLQLYMQVSMYDPERIEGLSKTVLPRVQFLIKCYTDNGLKKGNLIQYTF